MQRILHSRPYVDEKEWGRLGDVFASAQLSQGPQVQAFEEEMGRFLGLPPGVATSSGTAALHLALLALGVGPGDEVLLPSYVCTAPMHAICYVGATPVPVDVDSRTGNIDPSDLRRRLTPRSKAIIVVHLFGLPAPMEEIAGMGIPVIEDCAQSLGARLQGSPTGTFGHLSVTSFYATKLMTTGQGGMVFSASEGCLQKVRDLNDYDKRTDFKTRYNYKMTDIQGAVGRSQLERLNGFLEKRSALADAYARGLGDRSLRLPPKAEGRVYFRYAVGVDGDLQALIDGLARHGIDAARPIFRPLHEYLDLSGFPGAAECWGSQLSLPIHPALAVEDVARICEALDRVMEEATK